MRVKPINRRAFVTDLGAVLVAPLATEAQQTAQRSIPDEMLAIPLALLAHDSAQKKWTGTGFFVNQPDGTYLVTAKHVIYDDKNTLRVRLDVRGFGADPKDTSSLLMTVDLPLLASRRLLGPDTAQDIVVVKVGTSRSPATTERMYEIEG